MAPRRSATGKKVSAQGRAKAQEERATKVAALHSTLDEQVTLLTTSEGWKAWLDTAAKFHRYSVGNQLLILAQNENATRIAGYRAWAALGRQVRKGETGLRVLAPMPMRRKDGNDTQDAITPEVDSATDQTGLVLGWKTESVFDISQTDGDPLPHRPAPELLAGAAPEGLWDGLAAIVAAQGFTLERGDCDGANGYTKTVEKIVRVRADVDDAQAAKTLAHELGHVLLHADPAMTDASGRPLCRGLVEVEAESVAYIVASHGGLDSSAYTVPYVAGWGQSSGDAAQAIRATAKRVQTAAKEILTSLDELAEGVTDLSALSTRVAEATSAAKAVRQVAEAAVPTERERIKDATAMAAAWFAGQMDQPTRELLNARGVRDDTIQAQGVGYAPAGWDGLVEHLREHGFTDAELLDSGLASTSRHGNLIDTFRDRIMLPVGSAETGVVGFTARRRDDSNERAPKYLNTKATELYSKSEAVYGLNHINGREPEAVAIVEGPFDALAVTRASGGKILGLAPCGTALTDEQTQRIAALGKPIIVLFDADTAGADATERAWHRLAAAGVTNALIARLPEPGDDPASLAGRSEPQLAAILDLALDFTDNRIITTFDNADMSDAQACVQAMRDALAYVAAERDPQRQADQIQLVAANTAIGPERVAIELDDRKAMVVPGRTSAATPPPEHLLITDQAAGTRIRTAARV